MSQKIKEMNTEKLDCIFNPSQYEVIYSEEVDKDSSLNEEKKKREDKLYKEIVDGLESDMINLGMDLTYSAKMVIREVALNLVLLGRIKLHLIGRGLLKNKTIVKPDYIVTKRDAAYPSKISRSISYEREYLDQEEIHPVFDTLLPKLQKQINDGLKALGLLPSQQIERQKLVIVKKLRQKYESLESEVSVEARGERVGGKRKEEGGKLVRVGEEVAV